MRWSAALFMVVGQLFNDDLLPFVYQFAAYFTMVLPPLVRWSTT
jgi:hypothetical protein